MYAMRSELLPTAPSPTTTTFKFIMRARARARARSDGARWEAIAVLHEALARETELEITVPRPPKTPGNSLARACVLARWWRRNLS